MSIKKKIILLLVVGCIFAIGYFLMRNSSDDGNKIIPVSFGENVFHAEVVSSGEKLGKGLSQRKELCNSCAMLFEFQKIGRYSFWMKDMNFPIDIIWIKQGRVVHLEKDVQPDFKGVLTPKVEADMVLEINAGKSNELKINTGDVLDF